MAIITITSTNYLGGGIAVLIMFTLISLFLAIYFTYRNEHNKKKQESARQGGLILKIPKSPENILMISFCWFMFIVSSYMCLLFILETGESGGNTTYMMTTTYTLILTVIFIYLLVKYREYFLDKIKEWGLL